MINHLFQTTDTILRNIYLIGFYMYSSFRGNTILESVEVKFPKSTFWIVVLGITILKLTDFVIFPPNYCIKDQMGNLMHSNAFEYDNPSHSG